MFNKAIKKCIKNYIRVSGRAGRAEYWYFMLLFIIISIVNSYFIIDYYIGHGTMSLILFIFNCVIIAFLFFPLITVSCRRFHDINMKSTWIFIILIPLVGLVFYFVWMSEFPVNNGNIYGHEELL